ncbi:hypothetical protein TrCOL_g11445 [Triparma columacea]|uniref:Uncharacterized protein n=1 Tax=Triparma columacea TaxID=722753 RepID=A0A9W7GMC9_9STRA|nr:hypothetical protein TrCOL_g11445 [Triparma columacea]
MSEGMELPPGFPCEPLQRCERAARHLMCPGLGGAPCALEAGEEEVLCGLCNLPLCAYHGGRAKACGQCDAVICFPCQWPDEAHQKRIDMATLPAYRSQWEKDDAHYRSCVAHGIKSASPPHAPDPSVRHSIQCVVCDKNHCWLCWQSQHPSESKKDKETEPCWGCDSCNGAACMDCVVIVRPVAGWPKSTNWAGDEPAHVICNTCFDEDAEGDFISLY